MATGTLFIVFIVLMVLGTPLAVTFAMSAALPITIFGDAQVITMIQRFFSSADSFSLLAAPFFIMSGGFLDKGGVSKRLVDLANSLVGWLPGGLGVVVFLSCAFFGAISGSAIATWRMGQEGRLCQLPRCCAGTYARRLRCHRNLAHANCRPDRRPGTQMPRPLVCKDGI